MEFIAFQASSQHYPLLNITEQTILLNKGAGKIAINAPLSATVITVNEGLSAANLTAQSTISLGNEQSGANKGLLTLKQNNAGSANLLNSATVHTKKLEIYSTELPSPGAQMEWEELTLTVKNDAVPPLPTKLTGKFLRLKTAAACKNVWEANEGVIAKRTAFLNQNIPVCIETLKAPHIPSALNNFCLQMPPASECMFKENLEEINSNPPKLSSFDISVSCDLGSRNCEVAGFKSPKFVSNFEARTLAELTTEVKEYASISLNMPVCEMPTQLGNYSIPDKEEHIIDVFALDLCVQNQGKECLYVPNLTKNPCQQLPDIRPGLSEEDPKITPLEEAWYSLSGDRTVCTNWYMNHVPDTKISEVKKLDCMGIKAYPATGLVNCCVDNDF